MAHSLMPGVLAASLLCCLSIASASEPKDDDLAVIHARDMLMERLKAAEQSGVVVSRSSSGATDGLTEDAAQTKPAYSRAKTRPLQPIRTQTTLQLKSDQPCLEATAFAAERNALGDDPLGSIELIRQLEQAPGHVDRHAIRDQLALAYLSLGFADEAAATLLKRSPEEPRAAALALIAAAAGANAPGDLLTENRGLCGTLGMIAEFAVSTGPVRPLSINADAANEIATLPAPLATAVAARIVSRLIDLRAGDDAERALALLNGLADNADRAHVKRLRERLAALKAAANSDVAAANLPFSERLSKVELIVAHPEFVDELDAKAALRALGLLAALGAPNAIQQSKLLSRAPPATADFFLAKAFTRAGQLKPARAIADRHANDKAFAPLRETLALAAPSSGAKTACGKSSLACAWRSGDWARAQRRLTKAFAQKPTADRARKLIVAAALNGDKAAPASASALLRKDKNGAALNTWFAAAPSPATIAKTRHFSNAVTAEISAMKAMVNDE